MNLQLGSTIFKRIEKDSGGYQNSDAGGYQVLLKGRYKIVDDIGSGGFGRTYLAEDTQRPGKPHCVVKQLQPSCNDEKFLQLARRFFNTEAETLEKVGRHD